MYVFIWICLLSLLLVDCLYITKYCQYGFNSDFTVINGLGICYVIPGKMLRYYYVIVEYFKLLRNIFHEKCLTLRYFTIWHFGNYFSRSHSWDSVEYSGGFLKMLGIFPESFLLLKVLVCVYGAGEADGVVGLVPHNRPGLGRRKVRSEWLLTSSGRTALHLEHQWTPRMFSLTWRNIAPFKITAAPIFVKVKKTGKSAYYEDDDVIWEHLCCKLCASDVQSPQWYYHQNMPSW